VCPLKAVVLDSHTHKVSYQNLEADIDPHLESHVGTGPLMFRNLR
jgi:hypothetical protein